jgi:hypothetical protein
MSKNDSSKTILIIIAVILGILLLGGIVVGVSCYCIYKVGSQEGKSPAPTSTQGWRSYQNARYGFSLKYPVTFSAQESVNGDGVSMTSSSPAISVNVYGTTNSSSQSLDEYLNASRADLFKGQENAEEIMAEDTTLGGVPAQERQWTYINSIDGSQTIMDQVTALKGDTFYTEQMIIAYSDYSEYAPMFDEILASYQIK